MCYLGTMPKKRKIKNIKQDLWKLVAKSVKERDGYTCLLCGTKGHGSEIHCSHILPKGLYPRWEFEEWNLKALCMKDHLQFWHKSPLEAAEAFKEKCPDKYKFAMTKQKTYKNVKPYTRIELENRIAKYKSPITW
jgi:5-methylcytosine-specific restriction endonuclease McrA